jgi:pimeloyl-ACP methyl ester carboxylesterase
MTGVMEGAALAGRAVGIPALFRRVVSISNDPAVQQLRPERLPRWARAEISRHHVRHLLEAGAELGRFDATEWLPEIDVPTSVIVTETDSAIPPDHQRALAKAIRGARTHKLPGGHLSFAKPAFGNAIRAAVDSVARRASD